MSLATVGKCKRVEADSNILTQMMRPWGFVTRSEAPKHLMSRPFLKKGINHGRLTLAHHIRQGQGVNLLDTVKRCQYKK